MVSPTKYEDGWPERTAYALKAFSGVEAETLHPSHVESMNTKVLNGVRITKVPVSMLATHACRVCSHARELGYEPVILLHEYRALNAFHVIDRARNDFPMLAQHHGSASRLWLYSLSLRKPNAVQSRGLIRRFARLTRLTAYYDFFRVLRSKTVERKFFARIHTFFVLNKFERWYLSKYLKIGSHIRDQTMGVNFSEAKPSENKSSLRKDLGLPQEGKLLVYLGNIPDYLKGTENLLAVCKALRGRRVILAMAGSILDQQFAATARRLGAYVYDRLPESGALKLLAAADLYVLPARSVLYPGGITIALAEALACNVPAVSPTLVHFHTANERKQVGVATGWCDGKRALKSFINAVEFTLDNADCFRNAREVARKYYSWEIIAPRIAAAAAMASERMLTA